jgi:hypothetical protein
MEEYMNSRHFSGLYLMFIAVIRSSMFLQALSSPCVVKNCSESFGGSEMLPLSQGRLEDFTAEVLKTTILLYFRQF